MKHDKMVLITVIAGIAALVVSVALAAAVMSTDWPDWVKYLILVH